MPADSTPLSTTYTPDFIQAADLTTLPQGQDEGEVMI